MRGTFLPLCLPLFLFLITGCREQASGTYISHRVISPALAIPKLLTTENSAATLDGIRRGQIRFVTVNINNLSRRAIYTDLETPFTVTLQIPDAARLAFAYGVRKELYYEYRDRIHIGVTLTSESGEHHPLLRETVAYRGMRIERQCWRERTIELSDYAGQTVHLAFHIQAPESVPVQAESSSPVFWADPVILSRGIPPSPRNILVVLVDTLRADHVGCYGYPRATTPFLDALSRRSRLCQNTVAPSSWTSPSVASLLTGRYPLEHGVLAGGSGRFPDGIPSLATHLAGAGYYTAGICSNTLLTPKENFDSGFDYFDFRPIRNWQSESALSVYRCARRCLRTRHERPYFLYLHFIDPHDDYHTPAPLDSFFAVPGDAVREDIRNGRIRDIDRGIQAGRQSPLSPLELEHLISCYDREIRYLDIFLELFFNHLATTGLLQDTLVAVVADHGEEFSDHHGYRHGQTLYRELLHIPMLVLDPGGMTGIDGGAHSLLDLFPTVLARAGIEPPADLPGRILGVERQEEVPFYGQLRVLENAELCLRSVQLGRHKLVHDRLHNRFELFDCENDPAEHRPITADAPERERLQKLLADFLAREETGGLVREPAPAFDSETAAKLRSLGYLE